MVNNRLLSVEENLVLSLSVYFRRTPFDMNTTVRCMAMAAFQFYAIFCAVFNFLIILSLFFGMIIYSEAILNDIRSLLNRIDHLERAKDKGTKIALLEYCKKAIDLHVRLNRYFSISIRYTKFVSHHFTPLLFYFAVACVNSMM